MDQGATATPKQLAGWQAFDSATGKPLECVEMVSWPKVSRMSDSLLVLLARALRECFWSTDTSEGISVLLDRCKAA